MLVCKRNFKFADISIHFDEVSFFEVFYISDYIIKLLCTFLGANLKVLHKYIENIIAPPASNIKYNITFTVIYLYVICSHVQRFSFNL
jgi:hypothetical protein